MAKSKNKIEMTLKVRKKFEDMLFLGKAGKFDYSEPRRLGDMSKEELEAFYYAHDLKTRTRYLAGQPEPIKVEKEELPIKPKEE